MNKKIQRSDLDTQNSVRLSFFVSLSDIALNLIASILTGSAVLLSQALQGLSDAFSSLLVYIGYRHSKKRADKSHPLGYGREIFFWVLIASVLTGAVTGVISILRGINQLNAGTELEATGIAVLVLAIGLITNAYSVKSSMSTLVEFKNPLKRFKKLLGSSFVETKASVLIDSIGTFSAFAGLISILLYIFTGNTAFDGYGAILIGTITIFGAGSLIIDIHGFIIGRAANTDVTDEIKLAVGLVDGVEEVKHVKAIVIGSDQLLVIVDVVFDHHLSILQVENRSVKIRNSLRKMQGVRHAVVQSEQK